MGRGDNLRERTKHFALRVVRLYRALPSRSDAQVIGKQLLRSSTSVGANYRAVCRARSRPDFLSKIGIAIEEADESAYWLDLFVYSGTAAPEKLVDIRKEANE